MRVEKGAHVFAEKHGEMELAMRRIVIAVVLMFLGCVSAGPAGAAARGPRARRDSRRHAPRRSGVAVR